MGIKINLKNAVGSFFLVLVWLIPGMLLSSKNYADSFIYLRIGRAFNAIQTGKLAPIEYASTFEVIKAGYDSFLSIFLSITSFSPYNILYLPIGSVLLPFIYFCIVKSLSKSTKFAVFTSIYIAYLHALITVQYNLFVYVWTHISVLIFLLLVNKYSFSHKPQFSFLLLIVFVSNFTTYHSTTGWLLFMFLTFTVLNVSINLKKGINSTQNVSLLLAFITFYFSFESFIYSRLLPRVSTIQYLNPFDEGMLRFLSIFNDTSANVSSFQMIPKTSPLASLCTLAVIICLLAPLVVFIFSTIFSHNPLKELLYKLECPQIVFVVSIIFVPFFHFIAYYMYSGFTLSLRPMLLLFPVAISIIFSHLSTKKMKFRIVKIVDLYFILLILFTVVGFFSYYSTVERYDPAENFKEISKYISASNLDTKNNVMVADLFVHGRIAYNIILNGAETPTLSPFSPEGYSFLLNGNSNSVNFNYVVLNKENCYIPITGWNWEKYYPLETFEYKILGNNKLCKVYTDGSSYILLKNQYILYQDQ